MKKVSLITLLLSLVLVLIVSTALADGTETLGDPSIAIAQGSGVVAAGVGLQDAQPGVININVPGTPVQALLYWGGAVTSNAATDGQILVDGNPVNGVFIGGPTYFFSFNGKDFYYSNYRADITGLVASGANSFSISGLDNKDAGGDGENSGAGILVIYDDGTTAETGVKDGSDMAFAGFGPPLNTTVPQTFTFAPEAADRVADLVIFAGSVGAGRTSRIAITSDVGDPADLVNALSSNNGDLWDTLIAPVTIPAGASSLTVQILSEGGAAASLNWIGATLSVPVTPPPGGEGCTPGYWKQPHHFDSWGPTGYAPGDDFDTVFGTSYFDPDVTLVQALNTGGGGIYQLGRHGTAALLNAAHPDIDYPLTVAEVIALVQAGDEGTGDMLDEYNNLGCSLD